MRELDDGIRKLDEQAELFAPPDEEHDEFGHALSWDVYSPRSGDSSDDDDDLDSSIFNDVKDQWATVPLHPHRRRPQRHSRRAANTNRSAAGPRDHAILGRGTATFWSPRKI